MAYRFPLILLVLVLTAQAVRADELYLKNGDRITGTIKEATESSVTIITEYAGILKINQDAVATIKKDKTPETNDDGANPVKTIGQPPVKSSDEKSVFSGPAYGLLDGWEGSGSLGFSFSSGNSNYSTLTTGIRASKKVGGEALTIYARSLWTSTRSRGKTATTQNAYWGGLRFDRNFGQNLFSFISFDFERDRPKKLSFRAVPGIGLGRHLVRTENSEIDLLGGGAWNRTFQAGPNTDTPELLTGINIKHKLTPKIKFQKSFTFYQNATDLNEYRFLLDTTLNIDLTRRIGFYITAGDRFNNDPAGHSRKNDFLITTGIKWSFGTKR